MLISLEGYLIKFEKIFSKHSESKNDAIFEGEKIEIERFEL